MYLVAIINKTNSPYRNDYLCENGVSFHVIMDDDPEDPNEVLNSLYAKDYCKYRNIFIVNRESEAKLLARELSKAAPNKQVFWTQVKGIFEVAPADPIEKVVTEKGVLPA